jgi:hypothetical protein
MLPAKYNHRHVNAMGKTGWLHLYRLARWIESESGKMFLAICYDEVKMVMEGKA